MLQGEGDMRYTSSYCAHYTGNTLGQVSGTWERVVGMKPYSQPLAGGGPLAKNALEEGGLRLLLVEESVGGEGR